MSQSTLSPFHVAMVKKWEELFDWLFISACTKWIKMVFKICGFYRSLHAPCLDNSAEDLQNEWCCCLLIQPDLMCCLFLVSPISCAVFFLFSPISCVVCSYSARFHELFSYEAWFDVFFSYSARFHELFSYSAQFHELFSYSAQFHELFSYSARFHELFSYSAWFDVFFSYSPWFHVFFLILQVVPAVVAIVLIIGTFPFVSISIERLEKYSKMERHFRKYNSLTYITKKTLVDRIRKKVQLLKVVVRK